MLLIVSYYFYLVHLIVLEFSNDRKKMAKVFSDASYIFYQCGPITYPAVLNILKKYFSFPISSFSLFICTFSFIFSFQKCNTEYVYRPIETSSSTKKYNALKILFFTKINLIRLSILFYRRSWWWWCFWHRWLPLNIFIYICIHIHINNIILQFDREKWSERSEHSKQCIRKWRHYK